MMVHDAAQMVTYPESDAQVNNLNKDVSNAFIRQKI